VKTDFDCAQSDGHPERSRRVFNNQIHVIGVLTKRTLNQDFKVKLKIIVK